MIGLAIGLMLAAVLLPCAVWFGMQIGQEQEKQEHHDTCPLCITKKYRE